MKRIGLSIKSLKHPELHFLGSALTTEIRNDRMHFYSSHKFRSDEELEILCELNGEKAKYQVVINNIHEQISSGKIMATIPTEERPFPSLTFYRCFARVKSVLSMTGPKDIEKATENSNDIFGEGMASSGSLTAETLTGAALLAETQSTEATSSEAQETSEFASSEGEPKAA